MSSTGTRSRQSGNEQHDDEHTGAPRGAEAGRPESAGDQPDQDEPDDVGAAGKGRKVKSSTSRKTTSNAGSDAKKAEAAEAGKVKSAAVKSTAAKTAGTKSAAAKSSGTKTTAPKSAAAKSTAAKSTAAKSTATAKKGKAGPGGTSRAKAAAGTPARASGAGVSAAAGDERELLARTREAAAPGMAKLSELYFRHTPVDDLAAAAPEQLAAAVSSHYELAEQRAQGRPVLRVRDGASELGRPCTVVEIVNDDMPFLV